MFRCDLHKEYNPTCGPPSKGWDYHFENLSFGGSYGCSEGCPNCWRSYAAQLFADVRRQCEVGWDLRQDIVDLEEERVALQEQVNELYESRERVLTTKSHLATQYLKLQRELDEKVGHEC